jgi:hypothetical protein
MATVSISLGERKLTVQQVKLLEDKFSKKTITIDYKNSDRDLNGDFVDQVKWKAGLWDSICEEIGLKNVAARFVKSGVKDPTDCAVEVETWDTVYKGKLAFKAAPGDKTQRQIKKNSKPPHVTVRPSGVRMADCPTQFQKDLKHLIGQMEKTASYEYVGGTGSNKGWEVKFTGHQSHEQPGSGWKAYIDEPSKGNGTTWRLYFTLDFDTARQTLTTKLTKIAEDH